MSDTSSEAFFSRVNEDETQRLKNRVEALEQENAILKGEAGPRICEVLAGLRADILEEEAHAFSKATPKMSQDYQKSDSCVNPDLQEGYETGLEDSVHFLMCQVRAMRKSGT